MSSFFYVQIELFNRKILFLYILKHITIALAIYKNTTNTMKLTEHFSLEEMIQSSTATKLGIDNTPNKRIISELTKLCKDVLEPIRQKYNKPIIVTSGYRCAELNKAVKGASNSQHVYGTAADIKPKTGTVKELFNLIKEMADNKEIKLRQLIDEYNYSWIHLSVNDKYHGYKENQIVHIQ